jgi:hypothetical protein
MKVYKCINQVQADLAKVGISKDQRNAQQGYNFRGIDAVYNALAPLLAVNGLCILPKVIERTVTQQTSKSGGILFYVVVLMEFHFVASEDASTHIISTYGEAMDSGDKATNKAMSAAYKYACMQAFCIPTEGDNDTDAQTHAVIEEREVSTYDQVVALCIAKGVRGSEVSDWCKELGRTNLSALDEQGLNEILLKLQGK